MSPLLSGGAVRGEATTPPPAHLHAWLWVLEPGSRSPRNSWSSQPESSVWSACVPLYKISGAGLRLAGLAAGLAAGPAARSLSVRRISDCRLVAGIPSAVVDVRPGSTLPCLFSRQTNGTSRPSKPSRAATLTHASWKNPHFTSRLVRSPEGWPMGCKFGQCS